MTELLLVSSGTPNTCSVCGEMQETEWYAENIDMARSGQGKCPTCAGLKPKPVRKKRTTRKKPAPQVVE